MSTRLNSGNSHDHIGKQKNTWEELRQTHQSKIERTMGQAVDLPRHRNRLHLRGRRHQKPGRHEAAKVGVMERGAGGRGQVLEWHILVNK